jgi:hypothetical protein
MRGAEHAIDGLEIVWGGLEPEEAGFEVGDELILFLEEKAHEPIGIHRLSPVIG